MSNCLIGDDESILLRNVGIPVALVIETLILLGPAFGTITKIGYGGNRDIGIEWLSITGCGPYL